METLLQALQIVIRSTTALAALQAALNAQIFGTVEEEHKIQNHLLGHLSSPAIEIVLVTWEAVNEEFVHAGFL
jgi:hypothetical protein